MNTCLFSVAKLTCKFNEGRDLVFLIAIGSVPSWALSRWEGLNGYWGSEWTNELSKWGNLLESLFMPANNNFPWLCTVSRIRLLFSWRVGLQQVNQRASPCMHLQDHWRNKALEGTSGNTDQVWLERGSYVPKEHRLPILFMPWSTCSVLGYQDTFMQAALDTRIIHCLCDFEGIFFHWLFSVLY